MIKKYDDVGPENIPVKKDSSWFVGLKLITRV